mmetsp:Transcript_29955/g.84501  ORF Transcript_29955/g.84501 Transcript_29955/m.84501 type:complete len:237 (-) Transcript_29955:160-870(-)
MPLPPLPAEMQLPSCDAPAWSSPSTGRTSCMRSWSLPQICQTRLQRMWRGSSGHPWQQPRLLESQCLQLPSPKLHPRGSPCRTAPAHPLPPWVQDVRPHLHQFHPALHSLRWQTGRQAAHCLQPPFFPRPPSPRPQQVPLLLPLPLLRPAPSRPPLLPLALPLPALLPLPLCLSGPRHCGSLSWPQLLPLPLPLPLCLSSPCHCSAHSQPQLPPLPPSLPLSLSGPPRHGSSQAWP